MLRDVLEHLNKVGKRQESMLMLVDHIMKKDNPVILETGTMRSADNYEGDGMSTLLWHNVLRTMGRGNFSTIDSDFEATKFAYETCWNRPAEVYESNDRTSKYLSGQQAPSHFYCSDSVTWLVKFGQNWYDKTPIDVLYLDSWDMEFPDPTPSFMHIFQEYMLARQFLAPDALICVDDNIEVVRDGNPDKVFISKGEYIRQFMEKIGNKPLYTGYQIIWRANKGFDY